LMMEEEEKKKRMFRQQNSDNNTLSGIFTCFSVVLCHLKCYPLVFPS
jgi:hypothetical protein